jgi:hypothetical protein
LVINNHDHCRFIDQRISACRQLITIRHAIIVIIGIGVVSNPVVIRIQEFAGIERKKIASRFLPIFEETVRGR